VVDKQSLEKCLSFDLPEEVQPQAAALSVLVERTLGYQPFPLRFADVPVPGIRVDHVSMERAPTLLDAFFDSHLEALF
jgi:hypothetical protein